MEYLGKPQGWSQCSITTQLLPEVGNLRYPPLQPGQLAERVLHADKLSWPLCADSTSGNARSSWKARSTYAGTNEQAVCNPAMQR